MATRSKNKRMEWLKFDNIIIIITAILSGIGGTALVKGWLDRKKTAAEARNLTITGDTLASAEWQKLYELQKKDKEELRDEFKKQMNEMRIAHDQQIADIKRDFGKIIEGKDKEILDLNTKNDELEKRVGDLEKELDRYRNMEQKVDHAKEDLHTAVDLAAEQIKHPTKKENK